MKYEEFLQSKMISTESVGFEPQAMNPMLFPFQRDLTGWAIRKGKAALFTMTGTGKTLMQVEWAKQVHLHTGGDVLILAPLAVSCQTVKEASKIGVTVHSVGDQSDVRNGINITNYEKMHRLDLENFAGIVLDESSILKSYDGKTRTQIIQSFRHTPYRLACTATPAPNDFMELGNHAEFLGIMSRQEMLSMFFVHDGGETSKWRLKGHAESKFWSWVASWGAVLSSPSDLGYDDGGFDLPELIIHEHVIKMGKPLSGHLFAVSSQTLQERRSARRESLEERVAKCAELVNGSEGPFLVWCDLNAESEALTKTIDGAVQVKGSDSNDHKEKMMTGFSDGQHRVLVTKPSIAGWGLNWQHCRQMAFVGLSDSFEQYFQAVRRCWRFGQDMPVNVHLIVSDLEGAVRENLIRKENAAQKMLDEMVQYTKEVTKKNIRKTQREFTGYDPQVKMKLPGWLGGVAC